MAAKTPSESNKSKVLAFLWRWGWRTALLALGLFVGFGLPYLWRLDAQVRAEFEQLEWQIPTRVYARPLLLKPGIPLNQQALELELSASGYRRTAQPKLAGTFSLNGSVFQINTRAFTAMDGLVPSQKISVQIRGGRISSLSDARGKPLKHAYLDPARVATLYGAQQEERVLLRLEDAPELLVVSLQAVEDRNFKSHHGVDPMGILRALWVNLREGEVEQGGSTLTQQLVRSLFLSRAQTWQRKFKEASYALIIEYRFDKHRILETYLNQVYLGQQGDQAIHGMGAAAEFWFGRDLNNLEAQEIALLIGMIQGPSYYDPRRYPDRAISRRNLVLSIMHDHQLISADELKRGQNSALTISVRPGVARNRNPAFMDLVRRQLATDYPADALKGAGLTIVTTLSPSAQVLAEQAVVLTLEKLESKRGPRLQAGLVLTDAKSSDVLAMVGNRRVDEPGFNRALEAQRPIGSLIKPLVYLLALAQPDRWALSTPVEDQPIEVVLPNGKRWRPDNSDGQSHGLVTLEDALVHSYNQATVRVGLDVGADRVVALLKELAGVKAAANPSLVLGSVDLSPFAAAQAYQFLASGGQILPLRAVHGVLDEKGKAISRYDDKSPPAQAGDQIAVNLITMALQQAVQRGTGRSLNTDGLQWLNVAGKTGTTNDGRDSWFAGYTGDRMAVVWVGNDENKSTGLYGATGAMKVWSALFKKLPTEPLRVSETGLEWTWLDAQEFATTEQQCEGARRAVFVSGYLPAEHKSCQERRWFDWLLGRERERAPDEPGEVD